MRGQSQQVMLDSFFCSLSEDGDWRRLVSDRGFAKARDRLAWGALERLNTFVVERARCTGRGCALAWIARGGSRCLSLDASGAPLFDAQALGKP